MTVRPNMLKAPGQSGFALPLALVAIALLSLITLAGYRAVSGAAGVSTALQDNARMERAMFSAESDAAFVFLTSSGVSGGIVTDGALTSPDDILTAGPDTETLTPSQYWQANGGRRTSDFAALPVSVTYFDAAGFPPFDALSETDVAKFLAGAGFDADEAIRFAAIIGDYQDEDNRRRFRGAERTEYRLYGADPPSNSPLRTAGELSAVLGFADAAPFASWDFILENARFGSLSAQYKPKLGPESLASTMADDDELAVINDPLAEFSALDTRPTDSARFLLSVPTESGLTRRRAVEIIRTVGAADKPFRRIWIYDKVEDDNVAATQARERDGLAPVFEPAPSADPG